MTAQFADVVIYQNLHFCITGINGTGLFDPAAYGIEPIGWCTACWRGYHCTYEVTEATLFLTQFNIGLNEKDETTVLQGVGPKVCSKLPRRYTEEGYRQRMWPLKPVYIRWESSDFLVDSIKELVPFTGGLLLGHDFIAELYVHMGFHPAYKFRTVYELLFDAGHVVETHNRSAEMAAYRAALADRKPSPITTEEWVQQCFSKVRLGSRMALSTGRSASHARTQSTARGRCFSI